MKKIGFVDYYISEWHANNYPAWINEANEKLGTDYKVCYAWAELDKSLVDGVTTDEWCEKNGVEKCETIEELCEKSDYIIVLAPSNPETHLRYAEKVLPYGKRTYIDKTFAPDFATAKKIFDIAEKHGTPFFTTSALRFACELDSYAGMADKKSIIVTGPGGNFPEYAIHTTEMLIKLAGDKEPIRAIAQASGLTIDCTVEFEGGLVGKIIYSPHYPFTVYADNGQTGEQKPIVSSYFPSLMTEILNFFETGNVSFDTKQTLSCMKVREAIVKASENCGQWILLS